MDNYNHDGEKKFSSQGRVLRPRKSAGRTGYGEHRSYGGDRRTSGGEHRFYGSDSGERRSYGEHKPYDGERRSYGEHKSYNGDRKPYGEHKAYNADRKPYGEHKPYNGDRKPYSEHKAYNSDRKPYGENRGGYQQRNSRPYGNKPYRKSYGDKPYNKSYNKKYDAHFNEADEESINRMLARREQPDASRYSDFDGAATPIKEEIRLNKFIANSGVCSRREADTLIQAGVVTVNGEVVTELGTKVNVLKDEVRFNGERLKGEAKVYIVMNKPKGYVTTASDPHADKTVMDLLTGCTARVFPVGRLDKATTGVLMFTNDGEIAEKLTHPSYDKKKIYQVILDRPLKDEDRDSILSGIELADGPIAADELEFIDENDHRKLGIEIHSGKNRIVRRIFESFGYSVRALDRVYFAGLTKSGLKKGEWRYLTEGEANILKMGAYV